MSASPGAGSQSVGSAAVDAAHMARALELARAMLGRVAPNPAVGCVIVKDGAVAAEGATADGGRPHAEEVALDAAGARAEGATVYMSLEPCATRTTGHDACADRLVAARVARVVVACEDPHPFADGEGVARLKAAGIDVRLGVARREAEALNAGFFLVVREGRPFVAVDADPTPYDADLEIDPNTELLPALRDLAVAGLTRVRAKPGSPLAEALRRAGLADLDLG